MIVCEISPRPWLATSPFGGPRVVEKKNLRVLCPTQRNPGGFENVGPSPECGLFDRFLTEFDPVAGSGPDYTLVYWSKFATMNVRNENACPTGKGAFAPMTTCLSGERLGYSFWDPRSFDAEGGG